MLNLNKPFRHLFRKNATVKFLAKCDDPRWPLVFGVTTEEGTHVVQTNHNGAMTADGCMVIENAPEIEVRYCTIFKPMRVSGEYSIGDIWKSKPIWGDHIAGQLELTFEDGKLTQARICS